METQTLVNKKNHECIYVGRYLGNWENELLNFNFKNKNDSVDSYQQSIDKTTADRVKKTREFGYFTPHNCQFYQHFDEELPPFAQKMRSLSGLSSASVSMIRQNPGQTIPWHQDTFYKLRQKSDAPMNLIFRYIVFLEDWKTGHYLQIGETPLVKWRSGDIYTFPSHTYHLSGNFGIEPKFTLQVSGIESSESLHVNPGRKVLLAD